LGHVPVCVLEFNAQLIWSKGLTVLPAFSAGFWHGPCFWCASPTNTQNLPDLQPHKIFVNSMPTSTPRQTVQLRNRPGTGIQTICVVDPQGDDYEGWVSAAESSGLRLHVLASAEEALRLARNVTVDVWVVNTRLPGLSGRELCSMLRSQRRRPVVNVVADEYSPQAESAAWQARASLFLCKPAHRQWFDEWLVHVAKAPLHPAPNSVH
jgi:CheY-like chemotaxis protein